MSAVSLTDARSLALMCDTCGASLGGLTATLACWPVLWEVAGDLGWVGAVEPYSPHQCPSCGNRPASATIAQWSPLCAALREEQGVLVVRLAGDLDAQVAPVLRALLARAGAARRHLVLDLAAVHLIDSVGLAVLVRARQRLRGAGYLLVLAAASRFIRTVLHTMHVERVFPVFADTPDALAWLGVSPEPDSAVDRRPSGPS